MGVMGNLPFEDGAVAYRETFLGREKEIQDLENMIFVNCGAVHLVGPPRIGKTSLLYAVCDKNKEYPNRICVKTSLGPAVNAFGFWINLVDDILEAIQDADLWDPRYERFAERIQSNVKESENSWFTYLNRPLKSILKHLQETGYQLVLIIDEFDKVKTLFGAESAYFQLLRTIYSEPDYATSGIIISRRRLNLLEAECPDISTFHGVFSEYTLKGFSDEDMCSYDQRLQQCNVRMSAEGIQRLQYYAGRIPYLCCKLGNQLVRDSESIGNRADVDAAFQKCLPKINEYYDDLVVRLKEDNQMDFVFYLSIGVKPPTITDREIRNLKTMGILDQKIVDGEQIFYVYTQDFMAYIRDLPLQLPTADMIRESEKKLKQILRKKYPRLAEVTIQDLDGEAGELLKADLGHMYPDLHLNWTISMRNLQTNAIRNTQACLLDALNLTFVIDKILLSWDSFFSRYFYGDAEWKAKLRTIKAIRIPVAHAYIEYIDPKELAVCMQYCEELLRLEID